MERFNKNLKKYTTGLVTGFFILMAAGCMLEAPGNAQLVVSAASQLGASGYYGTLADVDLVKVYVYVDSGDSGTSFDATDPTNGALTSSDPLVAELTLTPDGNWTDTAPDVPTMTNLRIEAYAYGTAAEHDYATIDWDVQEDNTTVTLFSGTTSKFITSASARIYLAMRPYNDGTLQRLPRINRMTSNLNAGTLAIDFNDYGEVTWPDGSTSYETWYWRVVEYADDGSQTRAETSFLYGTEVPEAAYTFSAVQTGAGDDITLEYRYPDDIDTGDAGVVDWYNRLYWLEIANPQHNVLRQAFVMNPGADSTFDINFAPWIRNITAGRYYDAFAMGANPFPDGDDTDTDSVVSWEADVTDDSDFEAVRHLWILSLADTTNGTEYWAVYGDLDAAVVPAADGVQVDADWVANMSALLGSNGAASDLQSRAEVSQALAAVLAPLDNGAALTVGMGIDSTDAYPFAEIGGGPAQFTIDGTYFNDPDPETAGSLTGELFLLAFDGEFEAGAVTDGTEDNPYGYDDYSWSYVRMELDEQSFPALGDGSNGLIVFDGPAGS